MENSSTLNGESRGQKILNSRQGVQRRPEMILAETDPGKLLSTIVEGTNLTYEEIYQAAKQFEDFETASEHYRKSGVILGPKFLRDLFSAATTAHYWINKRPGYFAGTSQVKRVGKPVEGTVWTRKDIMRIYRESKYSLVATHNATAIAVPELRKIIRLGFMAESKAVVQGKDWNDGKKKRAKFNLLEFVKSVHKHYSMRVFCESTGYSPRYVLDFCHELNEGGLKVIPPTIKGADFEWLELYYPEKGDSSFSEAVKNKKPKKRGGKEIFKRVLHQENPNRKGPGANHPNKSGSHAGKKRRSSGGKRGYVANRGGKVKRYKDKLWGGSSHAERIAIENYLSS